MTRTLFVSFLAITLLGADRVPVAPDVELHYVERGSGPPLVFVPGWTMTTAFFDAQLDAFSDRHRVISYDPRSHGDSTKTSEGNTYTQHGRDLGALLEALALDDVVLVGWSSGCHDVLAYVRAFGTERLRAVVLVDEPPKAVGTPDDTWIYGSFDDYRSTLQSILYGRKKSAEGLARWMVERELTNDELQWIVSESFKTPSEAALALMVDTTLLDYTPEARSLDGVVPTLYMVRESWAESVRTWLQSNSPNAELALMSSHAEHWEKPEAFNQKLEAFLEGLK